MAAGRDSEAMFCRRDGTVNIVFDGGTGRWRYLFATGGDGKYYLSRWDGSVNAIFYDGTGRSFTFLMRSGTGGHDWSNY